MTIQPILEAIAITAACKLRWPELTPPLTRIIPCKRNRIVFPVTTASIWEVILSSLSGEQIIFDQMTLDLEPICNAWIGYEPSLDLVAYKTQ